MCLFDIIDMLSYQVTNLKYEFKKKLLKFGRMIKSDFFYQGMLECWKSDKDCKLSKALMERQGY